MRFNYLVQHADAASCSCRSPTPNIVSYEDPEPASVYAKDGQSTKSGSTITYGPFSHIPPSTSQEFQTEHQRPVFVQYDNDKAVISIISLYRSAEISHWGANLNIQDEVHLQNTGPTCVTCVETHMCRNTNTPP